MERPITEIQTGVAGRGEIAVLYPLPKTDNSWLQIAGIYKDDPRFEKWQAEIEAFRRERDLQDQV